jgi:hypothetical protein
MLKLKSEAEAELRKDIVDEGSKAFPLALTVPELNSGLQTLIQSFGLGPVKANTILLNWIDQPQKGIPGILKLRYAKNLKTVYHFGCNIVILYAQEDTWKTLESISSTERRIDVWWLGDATSRLMLLMAYLITRNEPWEGSRLRVLAVSREKPSADAIDDLKNILKEVRIEAEAEIVAETDPENLAQLSAEADLCFIPFRFRKNEFIGPLDYPIDSLLADHLLTALVLAAEDIDLDAEPEEGKAGETAAALDAFKEAEKRAQQAEEEAVRAAEEAEKKLTELRDISKTGDDEEILNRIKTAQEAKEEAIRTARKAAKAIAKAEEASREAKALGAISPKNEDEE